MEKRKNIKQSNWQVIIGIVIIICFGLYEYIN